MLLILIAAGYFGYMYYLKPRNILANIFSNKNSTSNSALKNNDVSDKVSDIQNPQNNGALDRAFDIQSETHLDPIMEQVQLPDINIVQGGKYYNIKRIYSYQIRGLVVSTNNGWNLSEDPLWFKDLCLVWGDANTRSSVYLNLKFHNENQICNITEVPGQSFAFDSLILDQLSNNHIVSNDNQLRDEVKKVRIGDQIYLQGYLIDYTIKDKEGKLLWTLNSSTSTKDRDCEVIYITNFRMIKANSE